MTVCFPETIVNIERLQFHFIVIDSFMIREVSITATTRWKFFIILIGAENVDFLKYSLDTGRVEFAHILRMYP